MTMSRAQTSAEAEGVIITNYGFMFLAREPQTYRWIYTYKEGEFKGYKALGFGNLKAWGDLTEFLWPVVERIDINWEALNDKEKSYRLRKIGELEGRENEDKI